MKFIKKNGRVIPIRDSKGSKPAGGKHSAPAKKVPGGKVSSTEAHADLAAKVGSFAASAGLGAALIASHAPVGSGGRTALAGLAAMVGGSVLGGGGAILRDYKASERLKKHGEEAVEREKARYAIGDGLSVVAGLSAPFALLGGAVVAKKGLSAAVKTYRASGVGKTTVMRTPFGGPMKDVYSSVRRLPGAY